MYGEFDEPEPQPERRDAEITLSSTTLLGIFFGMVLLCGLFFGLGFAAGRWGPADSLSAAKPVSPAQPVTSGKSKPSAAPEPQRAAASRVVAEPVAANLDPSARQNPAAQPVVQPAFRSQPGMATSPPSPMLAASAQVMVQIAAVSHQEDADVLVSALRKHGYGVTIRRLPTDNLLHVQIGPFVNRNDANAMRLKLLNDGYNAMVEP